MTHRDGLKTTGRIPAASSPSSPPHKTTFSFSFGTRRWRQRGPQEGLLLGSTSLRHAFVLWAVCGPHTTSAHETDPPAVRSLSLLFILPHKLDATQHNMAPVLRFLPPSRWAEAVDQDAAATVRVAGGRGRRQPYSSSLLVPRCCHLLQLFHNCLVSYH